MKPYWIRINWEDVAKVPLGTKLGIGVTADSPEDALSMVKQKLALLELPSSIAICQVRDVGDLDQKHVVPNMGNMLRRGIWFPLGYE